MSAGFEGKEVEFAIAKENNPTATEKIFQSLTALLKENGIYSRTYINKISGNELSWNSFRVRLLVRDLIKRERKFFIEDGELKSYLRTVLLQAEYIDEKGKKWILKQSVREDIVDADENNNVIEESKREGVEEPKSGVSSISGKLNIDENESPYDGAVREIKEETGLEPGQYVFTQTPIPAGMQEQESRGFPMLKIRNDKHTGKIRILKSGYKDFYEFAEDWIYDDDNNRFVQKHSFLRWVEAPVENT